ncbi:phosphate ABC transporter substrate-binding protein PstS [Paracoccus laeviglucosivorans]|uniref:Phosphate-binding protein PstS n=1 Tax=Paracoccus laeviglucosivorans TaxID=1197861 RepID=A0A521E975_9RHOB|nr:phosphate ABC transporter substrate-binding protein PstS [Paracoccus laeviglucosivorans]SMO80486.1 phosphate ABC transporter substrate-binding protein, PhoT family [Paracoccus laeviglucosivorans]
MLALRPDGVEVVAKPWGLGRRIATSALAFIAIGFIVFAAAGSSDEGRLEGAGSTLANPILQRVSTSYQSYLAADRVDLATQQGQSGDWVAGTGALDYDPIGSVGGLIRLNDPAMTFAVTEVPMSPAELENEGRVQFPLILGATAPVINLDLGGADLVLNADVLSAIYLGQITRWTDPAIAALNQGIALPDQAITVNHRSDGSGSSWTFTGYLAKSPGWTAGQTAQTNWPTGNGAEGSRGMIDAVKATEGAIGYAEIGQASRAGLGVVHLIDGAGKPVAPSAQTIRAAATVADWRPDTQNAAASTAQGWPMTATVYVVLRRDNAQNARALAFFRYFYAEAARRADALGYVALPEEVVQAVEAYWGETVNQQS